MEHRSRLRVAALSLALAAAPFSPFVQSQTTGWSTPMDLGPLSEPVLVFDNWRRQPIALGTQRLLSNDPELREFDGMRWRQRGTNAPNEPRLAFGFRAAFDAGRGELVAHGGDPASRKSTHVWNGSNWRSSTDPSLPDAAGNHSLVFDSTRGSVLLVTGTSGQPLYRWSGSGWSAVPTTQPVTLTQSVSVDIPSRRSVIVIGRVNNGSVGISEWTGTAWVQHAGPIAGSGRIGAAWDPVRSRLVAFIDNRTHEWDGRQWSLANNTPPRGIQQFAMTYDATARTTIMIGTSTGPEPRSSLTWSWNGTRWTELRADYRPADRAQPLLAHDPIRGTTIMYGGHDPSGPSNTIYMGDTWTFDGAGWRPISTPVAPPARAQGAMVFDLRRNRMVLFGGARLFSLLNDTWEFDGSTWTQRMVSGPPAQAGHAMAFDAARGRTVLFGAATTGQGETWEFDGSSWTRRMISGPPARFGHAMTYDFVRQRIVLFGGSVRGGGELNDTWEFDGASWRRIMTPLSPPARSHHAMIHDVGRQAVLMHGGGTPLRSTHFDTWSYDGRTWARIDLATQGSLRKPSLVYDVRRSQLLRVGSGSSRFGPLASIATTGLGCGGASGVPRLGSRLPRAGEDRLRLELSGARPGAAMLFALSAGAGSGGSGACRLHLGSPIVPLSATTTQATGFARSDPFAIPASAGVLGAGFFAQGFVLDPTTPTGIAFSDGKRHQVGW